MLLGFLFFISAALLGLLMAESLFKEEPPEARWALGGVMACSFLMLVVLLLGAFKATAWGVRSLVLGPLAALAALKNRPWGKIGAAQDPKNFFLLIGVLVVLGLLAYSPHFSYPYPLHYDEWYHLAFADKVIETGRLFVEPYHGTRLIQHEAGFHSLLAAVFLLAGLDPLPHFKFLPAIATILTGLGLCALLREISGAPRTGILGVLLYATLKSDISFFGPMTLTPFMMALPFMIMVFFTALRWLKTGKGLYLHFAAFLICAMCLIHPTLAFFTLMLLGLMLAMEEAPLRASAPDLAFVIVFCLLIGLFGLKKGSWAETVAFVRSHSLVPVLVPIENFFSYISPPLFFFMACGYFHLWKERKSSVLMMLGLTTLVFLFAYKTGWSLVLRAERLFFLTLLFSVIAGAIGLSCFADFFKPKRLALILALGVVACFQFRGYFEPVFNHYMTDRDYETLLWLKKNYSGKRVLSSPQIGLALPFTRNYALSYAKGGPSLPEQDLRIMRVFDETGDCSELQGFIGDLKAEFVVSSRPFDCPFLRRVYHKTGFVYEPLASVEPAYFRQAWP